MNDCATGGRTGSGSKPTETSTTPRRTADEADFQPDARSAAKKRIAQGTDVLDKWKGGSSGASAGARFGSHGQRGDDRLEAIDVPLRHVGPNRTLEAVQGLRDSPCRPPAGRREVNDQGAPIAWVELAKRQSAPLEPVQDVGQRGPAVTELAMQRRDWTGAVRSHPGQDVRLALGDPEPHRDRRQAETDEMRPPFERRRYLSHMGIY